MNDQIQGAMVTDSMLSDAIAQDRADRPMMIRVLPPDLFDQDEVKRLAGKIHIAMCVGGGHGAEPTTPELPEELASKRAGSIREVVEDAMRPRTTPEPDGLIPQTLSQGELNYLYGEHLDAHDAALAELRDGFDMLTSRVTTHGRRLDRVDPLPSIEDMRGVLAPTPPAVPDAGDDEKWSDVLEAMVGILYSDGSPNPRSYIGSLDKVQHFEHICKVKTVVAKAFDLGLTPAPPPLVVDNATMDAVSQAMDDNGWRPFPGDLLRVLKAAAQHWNTTRVPTGDDMGNTSDVGGKGE